MGPCSAWINVGHTRFQFMAWFANFTSDTPNVTFLVGSGQRTM